MRQYLQKSYFLLMYCLVILFNYPGIFYSSQPQGTDTFTSLAVSNLVSQEGHDFRFVSLFSFFGLSPYSNCMGGSFLLSGVSIVSGLKIDDSIFVLESVFFVSLGFFGMFLLSYIYFQDVTKSVSSAFILMTGRRLLALTRWSFSFRGPYLCLLVVLILLLFIIIRPNIIQKNKLKPLILSILILIGLASLHHMFYFNLILISTAIVFFVFNRYSKSFVTNVRLSDYLKNPSIRLFLLVSLYVFSIIGYTFYERNNALDNTNNLTFIDFYNVVYEVLLTYAKSFGLLFAFVPVGVLLTVNDNKGLNNFIFIILIFYSPVFFDGSYALLTLLPFIVLLSVKGIYFAADKISNGEKRVKYISIIAIILIGTVSPEFFVFNQKAPPIEGVTHDKNQENGMAKNLGLYIHHQSNYPLVHQTSVIGGNNINAYALVPMYRSDMYIPVYSDQDYWELRDFTDVFSGEQDTFFEDTSPSGINLFTAVLLSSDSWDSEKVKIEIKKLSTYNATSFLVATYSEAPTVVVKDDGIVTESVFLNSVHNELYTVYLGEYHRVNFINYED